MKYFVWLIAFTGAVICASCKRQNNKTEKSTGNELDEFIQRKADSLIKADNVHGIFVGILNNGQRQYYSFGYADPDRKMPFDSATIFEIGSITKTFTAYVLESVLKANRISDSSAILPYLPDSVQKNKALASISFLSLLNHTSGLARLPGNMDVDASMSPYNEYDEAALFAYLKKATTSSNGKSNYSNLGAGLAGILAARIAGKSYTDLLKEYVFVPFNIPFHSDKDVNSISNKSQGYFETDKAAYWQSNALGPAYALKLSSNEMLTYMHHLAMPQSDEAKEITATLLTPTAPVQPDVNSCRGWHTLEKKDKPVLHWHNGGTYGFSTFGGFINAKDKAVIVVVNQFNKNIISDGLGFAILNRIGQ